MRIKFIKENDKFQILSFATDHKHHLHLESCTHMMSSQRKISQAQCYEVDIANESRIQPKSAMNVTADGPMGGIIFVSPDKIERIISKLNDGES